MVRFIIVINIDDAIGGRECNTSLQHDALPFPLPPPVDPLGRMWSGHRNICSDGIDLFWRFIKR